MTTMLSPSWAVSRCPFACLLWDCECKMFLEAKSPETEVLSSSYVPQVRLINLHSLRDLALTSCLLGGSKKFVHIRSKVD